MARPNGKKVDPEIIDGGAATLMGLAVLISRKAEEIHEKRDDADWGDVGDLTHLNESLTDALLGFMIKPEETEAQCRARIQRMAIEEFEAS